MPAIKMRVFFMSCGEGNMRMYQQKGPGIENAETEKELKSGTKQITSRWQSCCETHRRKSELAHTHTHSLASALSLTALFIHLLDNSLPATLIGIARRDWEMLLWHQPFLTLQLFASSNQFHRYLFIFRVSLQIPSAGRNPQLAAVVTVYCACCDIRIID